MDPKNRKQDVGGDLDDTKLDKGMDDTSVTSDDEKLHQGKEWDSAVKEEGDYDAEGDRDTDLDIKKGGDVKPQSEIQGGDKFRK